MEESALKVLKILEDNHQEAYIVGGYVRDKLLGVKSSDIDICTSATPREIIEIFKNQTTKYNYGSVGIIYKNLIFDVTTYRKEIKYENNRKPVKIKYIKKIKADLLRRDFTINTFCMDSDGQILDILNVRSDLDNRIIKTVGNPRYKLKEDALRILRAIRFATVLDFEIEEKTKYYLNKYAYLLKKLSYTRKKQELDKIFMSKNREKGVRLILELKLDKYLEIPNLKDVVLCNDILGIWTQLNVDDIYPFTKVERDQMKKIRELLSLDIDDKYNIYKYGLYKSTVAHQIKGSDITNLNIIFKKLPIKSSRDICIGSLEIAKLLSKDPGSYLKDIIYDLEKEIVYGNVDNNKEDICKYIKSKYLKGEKNDG